MCEGFNFAGSPATPHTGYVIDKRGHVFWFETDRPAISGTSVRGLAVLARSGKRYLRTLEASEVDRLVQLTSRAEAEPIVVTKGPARADAGGHACYLIRGGGAPDAMVRILLDDTGNIRGNHEESRRRTGPASNAARKLLDTARGASR